FKDAMINVTLNNIDLAQIDAYEAEIRANPKEAEFTTKIEGTWLYEEGGPQFSADAKTKNGVVTFELSHPNFSGPGPCPSPMAYGLFWIAGCASATFMSAAEKKNICISSLKTKIEADLNYLKQFKLGEEPLVSAYRLFFEVQSDASDEDIEGLRLDALNGCMAMYTIQNPVPLKVTVIKQ
ncbi:MAG TPA: OsmC family protein, partial [Methanospirillum sp.]|nr:OsmC family protein [Methanospirillum sp.]